MGTRGFIGLFLFLCACLRATAQSNAIDGALEGYIHDATGGTIAKVHVEARNIATNASAGADSDDNGYFRFPLLKIGTYKVAAQANGFKTYEQSDINIGAGDKIRLDVAMQIGTQAEIVEVTASTDIALADTGSSAVGGVVGRREVEGLPILSRNVYNFQLLAPGVQGYSSSTFGTPQFVFGGNERSNWTLDGLDNTQRGSSRQIRMVITTPEAVDEVQVLSNGYSAEFGRAAGGQMNVILKSGGNEHHGSALFLYRPEPWQARPSLAAVTPSSSWWDMAYTLGGPIKKDRLFYFAQYEHNPYDRPNAISILPQNAAALNLATDQRTSAPFGETYDTFVGKMNYVLNEKNTGYVRYARFTNHQPNNASGLTIPDRGVNFDDHMNGGGAQLATSVTPNLLNELRVGTIQRTQENAPVGKPNPYSAAVNIQGIANIGYNPLANTASTEISTQAIDNVTWTHGRSTWKAGIDFEHTSFNIFRSRTRAFSFNGLTAATGRGAVTPLDQYLRTVAGTADPATGRAYTYSFLNQDGGDPSLDIGFNFVNWFIQDEIRVTPRFSVNLGIRHEMILFPSLDPQAPYPLSRKIDNDPTAFSPRVSLTWQATSDAKTVVRAAFGTYYDVPPLSLFYTPAQVNGRRFLSYQISGSDANAPIFPNVPTLTDASLLVKPNINAFAPGYKNTYQIQSNVQIQRELMAKLLLTVGYQYAAQRHGLYAQNINTGSAVRYLADGRPVFGGASLRPNQDFNQINLIVPGANTNYNGLFVNLKRRLTTGLEFQASYTWSHTRANNIGEGGNISDPTNLQRDYGNADTDLRHYLVTQWLYEPHFSRPGFRWANGFQLSSMIFYNSGYPINALAGTDLNGDGIVNDRPLYRVRNDRSGPGLTQVDARIQRTFSFRERYRLVALLEAENALNTTNANCSTAGGCTGAVINIATAPDFGRITSARTARNVQFGVKFLF